MTDQVTSEAFVETRSRKTRDDWYFRQRQINVPRQSMDIHELEDFGRSGYEPFLRDDHRRIGALREGGYGKGIYGDYYFKSKDDVATNRPRPSLRRVSFISPAQQSARGVNCHGSVLLHDKASDKYRR